MVARTNNFGLVALQPGDSLSAGGYGFINDNIFKIDRLLAAATSHDHTDSGSGLADPVGAPVLTLSTSSGNLPAGTTIRYRYSYVDQYGSETAASPEAMVSTAAVVQKPGSPNITSVSTGGSLLGGNYNYAVSAYVTSNTNETDLGGRQSASVAFATATNVNTVTLPALPAGATGFNIYRRAPGEAFFSYLASTTGATYSDDGGTTPNYSRQPQIVNLTNSTNNVLVALPGPVPANATWKIYRTFVSGNWETSNLKQITQETFVGSGIIVDEYTDLGLGTGLESAPEVTEIAQVPSKISNNEVDFAYVSYSPTITGWAEGDGTLTASYAELGKLVFVKFNFVYGGTSTSASPLSIPLPVNAATTGFVGMNGMLTDSNTGNIAPAAVEITGAGTFTLRPMSSVTQLDGAVENGTPWTWATSDVVSASFVYEAA